MGVSMKSVLRTEWFTIVVDGATIRAHNNLSAGSVEAKVPNAGVVSILPMVQVVIGSQLITFLKALELSRIPLALMKTSENGKYATHDIIRLETGNVGEAVIATVSEYNGIIVGISYNREILQNRQFRKMVKLSAMHQVTVCKQGDPMKLVKATQCTSLFTGVPRDKLVAIEKARSIRVRVNYRSKLNLPLYYIYSLDNANSYILASVAFDLNEAAKMAHN